MYFFVSDLIYDTPRAGLLLVFMSVVKKVSENAPICNNSYENPPQQTKHAVFSLLKIILDYIYLLIKTHKDKTSLAAKAWECPSTFDQSEQNLWKNRVFFLSLF